MASGTKRDKRAQVPDGNGDDCKALLSGDCYQVKLDNGLEFFLRGEKLAPTSAPMPPPPQRAPTPKVPPLPRHRPAPAVPPPPGRGPESFIPVLPPPPRAPTITSPDNLQALTLKLGLRRYSLTRHSTHFLLSFIYCVKWRPMTWRGIITARPHLKGELLVAAILAGAKTVENRTWVRLK